MENKEAFVQCLNAAFIAGDSERYHHLIDFPVVYFKIGAQEYLGKKGHSSLIAGCSCAAIAKVFVSEFV